jgi:hypothetical protein
VQRARVRPSSRYVGQTLEDVQGDGDILQRDGLLDLLILVCRAGGSKSAPRTRCRRTHKSAASVGRGRTLFDLGLELGHVVLLPLAERCVIQTEPQRSRDGVSQQPGPRLVGSPGGPDDDDSGRTSLSITVLSSLGGLWRCSCRLGGLAREDEWAREKWGGEVSWVAGWAKTRWATSAGRPIGRYNAHLAARARSRWDRPFF